MKKVLPEYYTAIEQTAKSHKSKKNTRKLPGRYDSKKKDLEHLKAGFRKGQIIHSKQRLHCSNHNKQKAKIGLTEEPSCQCAAPNETAKDF